MKRLDRVLWLLLAVFAVAGGVVVADPTSFSAVKIEAVSAEATAFDVRNTSGTSVYSITNAGVVAQTGAQTFAGNLTLDDGVTASPSLTFTDATNETAVLSKADAGFLSVTTVAGDGLSVLTGNLKVGNGTPGVTQDGEDAYVEGVLEVDGAAWLDGLVTTGAGLTLHDGAGASPSLIFKDGSDDTTTLVKAENGFLSLTTAVDDGLNILVGNLKVGNGSAANDLLGESVHIEGGLEVDGEVLLDGATTIDTVTVSTALTIPSGADPGASCSTGQIFLDTDETVDTNCTTTADNSLCLCVGANTWTALENN